MEESKLLLEDKKDPGYPTHFHVPIKSTFPNPNPINPTYYNGLFTLFYDKHSQCGITMNIQSYWKNDYNPTFQDKSVYIKDLFKVFPGFTPNGFNPSSISYALQWITPQLNNSLFNISIIETNHNNLIDDSVIKQCLELKKGEHFDVSQLNQYYVKNHLWSNNFVSNSGVTILNTVNGVFISMPTNAVNIPIDFQDALTKYLKEQVDENSTEVNRNELKLLKNSKITAIWELVPDPYLNAQPIPKVKNSWWSLFNKEAENPASSSISHVIIGYAVNNEDNKPFFWVTDLGKGNDISVLLTTRKWLPPIIVPPENVNNFVH